MSGTVVEVGDKLHIITRRLFEDDIRRHFVGEVVSTSYALAEVRGYTFIFQTGSNEFQRLPEERSRIFSLGEAGFVVNKIPKTAKVASIVYKTVENRLVITDGRSFTLPINEFGASR